MQPSQGEGIHRENIFGPGPKAEKKETLPEKFDLFRKPELGDLPPTSETTERHTIENNIKRVERMPDIPKVLKDTARMVGERKGFLNEVVRSLLIQAI